MDNQDRGGADSPDEEVVAVVHDLIEALTAIGNYFVAMQRVTASGLPPSSNARTLNLLLERGLSQVRRATVAATWLRARFDRRGPER